MARTTDDVLQDASSLIKDGIQEIRGDIKGLESNPMRQLRDLELTHSAVQARADDLQDAADDLQALIDEYKSLQ